MGNPEALGFRASTPEVGESITIRHFDLRQTLGVHHLVFFDDVVLVEQKSRQSVDFVGLSDVPSLPSGMPRLM